MDSFYSLPLWMQIYIQNENDPLIRGQMRMTTKKLNNPLLLCEEDILCARRKYRLGWYNTTHNFISDYFFIITDESEEGIELYNYYHTMFESAELFLNNFVIDE